MDNVEKLQIVLLFKVLRSESFKGKLDYSEALKLQNDL